MVKEYYEDELIYEGGFLNGERNGKGKEYHVTDRKEKLVFDVEYLNGKKIKGKVYNPNQHAIYEINQRKNGYVKEYNDNGEVYFEGQYLNGKRNGEGTEFYMDGNKSFEWH